MENAVLILRYFAARLLTDAVYTANSHTRAHDRVPIIPLVKQMDWLHGLFNRVVSEDVLADTEITGGRRRETIPNATLSPQQ